MSGSTWLPSLEAELREVFPDARVRGMFGTPTLYETEIDRVDAARRRIRKSEAAAVAPSSVAGATADAAPTPRARRRPLPVRVVRALIPGVRARSTARRDRRSSTARDEDRPRPRRRRPRRGGDVTRDVPRVHGRRSLLRRPRPRSSDGLHGGLSGLIAPPRSRSAADEQDPHHPVVVRDERVAVHDPAVAVAHGPGDRDVLAIDRVLRPLLLAGPQRRRVLGRVVAADDVRDDRRGPRSSSGRSARSRSRNARYPARPATGS